MALNLRDKYSDAVLQQEVQHLASLYREVSEPKDVLLKIQEFAQRLYVKELIIERLLTHPYTDFLRRKSKDRSFNSQGQRWIQMLAVESVQDIRTLNYSSIDILLSLSNERLREGKVHRREWMKRERVQLRFQFKRMIEQQEREIQMMEADGDKQGQGGATLSFTRLWYKISFAPDYEPLQAILEMMVVIPGDQPELPEGKVEVEDDEEEESSMEKEEKSTKKGRKRQRIDEQAADLQSSNKGQREDGIEQSKAEEARGDSEADGEDEGDWETASMASQSSLSPVVSFSPEALDQLAEDVQVSECTNMDLIYFLLAFPFHEEEWEVDLRLLDALLGEEGKEIED